MMSLKGITRTVVWKTGTSGQPNYVERAIKNEMLTESIRTELLGFSLANGNIYLTNLMNKYEASLLY